MPSFEHDIRPLFRDDDIQAMDFAFDLSAYQDVKDHAQSIEERLADGSMPCDAAWTEAQIDLFRQWMNDGYAR